MSQIKISGAKLPVTIDVHKNEQKIIAALERASKDHADILVTPEGALSGYYSGFDQEEVEQALLRVEEKAKQLGVGMALGVCYRENDSKCYNQLRFYDQKGNYLGFHSKILLCQNVLNLEEGECHDFSSTELKTFEINGIVIGGLVCNDMWANPKFTDVDDPHLVQKLARMGAKIILHGVNGGSRDQSVSSKAARMYHEANLLMRAMAGNVWIATVDNSHPTDQYSAAPSGIVSPDGQWHVKTEWSGEEYFVSEISL